MPPSTTIDKSPAHLKGLLRHLVDLRDGVHGDGAVSRGEKVRLFIEAVKFLSPFARRVLREMNAVLLLDTGTVAEGDWNRSANGGLALAWSLSWPEQREQRIAPVTLEAFFGSRFHHPHLRGATVGNWPLNVFSLDDAAAELPTLRTIAIADLHNLVFQSDFRIVPAVLGPPAPGR